MTTNRLRHKSRRVVVAKSFVGPLVTFAVFIMLWYVVSTILLSPQKQFLLPRPDVVLTDGFLTWQSGSSRGFKTILESLWITTQTAVIGLIVTSVIGIATAVLMSMSTTIERATWPYLVALQAAPIIALSPLIRALIDDTTLQRLLVVFLVSFFPITSATLHGLTSVPREFHDLFSTYQVSRWQRLLKLKIPHSLPSVFLGLRTSAGLAVIGAVVGDFYFRRGGTVGIGAQIDLYRAQLWGPELVAAVIMASLLGIVLYLIFTIAGNKVVGSWHTKSAQ